MSESKSKIISFRISAELEAAASSAAAADGEKNASAWCQKLVLETLSKLGEANQNENAEKSPEPAAAADLLKALNNLRQLNLDCFKMTLKGEDQYKDFLNVVIASEEEWETITRNIGKSEVETPRSANEEPACSIENFSPSANSGKQEKVSEVQIVAEEISGEYLLFAEEMQNEVAELVGGGPEVPVLQNNRAIDDGESATINQVPVVPPIHNAMGRTDGGKRF